jgi:hypothetical protein
MWEMALMGTSIDVPRMRGLSPCWVTPDSPPCPPPGVGRELGGGQLHEAREARRNRPELSARHRLGGWRALEGIAPSNSAPRVPNSREFRPEVLANCLGLVGMFLTLEDQSNGGTHPRA